MNSRKEKRPFMIRTIVALILLYGFLMSGLTVAYADNYANEVFETSRVQAEEIAADIRGCMNVNPQSVEYRNGFNVAQVAAVMEYYRFVKRSEFKKKGIDFDVTFYKINKDKDGQAVSFEEMQPKTPVLIASPGFKNGGIIVFKDSFNKDQMNQLKAAIKKNQMSVYIENAQGYQDGRFFQPTRIAIGEAAGKEIVINTDYKDNTRKKTTASFQDFEILGLNDSKPEEKSYIRKTYEKNMKQDLQSGSDFDSGESGYHWTSLKSYAGISSSSGNYILEYGVECKPMAYAFSQLKVIYLFSVFLFLIIGEALLSSHNKMLRRRMGTEEKRRRMMDAMAHEMKTPLGIIKNYGEVLAEEENQEKAAEYVQTIIEEADHMNEVVVSMLDLSKMEAGTYPLELSSLSVGDIARRVADRTEILRQRKNLRLELDIHCTERILADEKLITNIILNFVLNAIHHAKADSAISLEVRLAGKEVYIAVHNQGERIPKKDMEKIWNSFFRSDSARSRHDGGSGLGLAIVRNACLMHGGSYGCENEIDGVTFWVRIGSMEGKLKKTEIQTGPVLNVTGNGYRLKGLALAGIGLIVQSLGSYEMYLVSIIDIFSKLGLFSDFLDYGVFYSIFMILGTGLTLLGWGMLLSGVIQMQRGGKPLRGVIISAVVTLLAVILVEVKLYQSCIDVQAEVSGFFLTCEGILPVVMTITVILMFAKCGNIAKSCGDRRFRNQILWKAAIYLVVLVLYIILIVSGNLWVSSLFVLGPVFWIGINVFVACAWIQTFRRFNGKEPFEK